MTNIAAHHAAMKEVGSTVALPTFTSRNRQIYNKVQAVPPKMLCPLPLQRHRSIALLCKQFFFRIFFFVTILSFLESTSPEAFGDKIISVVLGGLLSKNQSVTKVRGAFLGEVVREFLVL